MDLKAVAVGPAVVDTVPAGVVEVVVGVVAGPGVRAPVLKLHPDRRPGAVRGQLGVDEVVPQVPLFPAQDVHVPEDAAHAELVLILEVAAVAPLQHQYVDLVVPGGHEIGDVELAGGVGDLAVAHEPAVDPEVEAGVHALEHDGPAAVVLGQHEVPPVQAAGVLLRHVGRVVGERVAPVGVLVPVVAVHLPHRGHGNAVHLHAGVQQVVRQIDDAFKVPELPFAVERLEAVRLPALVAQGDIAVRIRNVVGPVGQRVHMQRVGIHVIIGQIHGSDSSVGQFFGASRQPESSMYSPGSRAISVASRITSNLRSCSPEPSTPS